MFDERTYRVLWAVVESYISNADPVGSRFVSKKYAFNLSPATIRNIMADLEEMGFLQQPHTSAGRVPTDKGYRFYVDSLTTSSGNSDLPFAPELVKGFEDIRDDIQRLLREATKALSAHSHCVGIALSPNPERSTLRRITIYRHKRDYVSIVLLTDEGIVKNRIMHLDSSVTNRDLDRIAEYLNDEFAGYTVDQIKARIVTEMQREKVICDDLIAKAIRICRDALYFDDSDVFVSGFSEVLGFPEFADLARIREISRAIEDKHLIVKLLDSLSALDGVNVVIGTENPAEGLKNVSMVVSTYKEGGRPIGTIGIIGPTRMDYQKAITLVDRTAKILTRILTEK